MLRISKQLLSEPTKLNIDTAANNCLLFRGPNECSHFSYIAGHTLSAFGVAFKIYFKTICLNFNADKSQPRFGNWNEFIADLHEKYRWFIASRPRGVTSMCRRRRQSPSMYDCSFIANRRSPAFPTGFSTHGFPIVIRPLDELTSPTRRYIQIVIDIGRVGYLSK